MKRVLSSILQLFAAVPLTAQQPQQPSQPTFAITAGLAAVHVDTAADEVRVLAPGYKLLANGGAFTFAPYRGAGVAGAAVTFRLRQIRRGELALTPSSVGLPLRRGDRLELDHGIAVEEWILREKAAEQCFRLEVPGAAGDLVLALAITSTLRAEGDDRGVRFVAGDKALVHYGNMTVVDADGRSLTTATRLVGDELQLVVPATFLAMARGPLWIDPIVTPIAIDTGNDDVRNPEVAYDPANFTWLVVYERHFSANDIDILSRRYTGAGALMDEVSVAIGSRESRNPAVGAAAGQRFLVVWDEDRFLDRVILGRIRDSGAVNQGAEFLVRNGSFASNQNAAVGGSIATDGSGDLFAVVCEESGGPLGLTIVSNTGVVGPAFSIAGQLARPRISRARTSNEAWLMTCERNGDVFVAALNANGVGDSVVLTTPNEFDREPTVTGRSGEYFVAWVREDPQTNIGSVVGRSVTLNGTSLTVGLTFHTDIRQLEPGSAARDQSIPTITRDGANLRYTLAYRERRPTQLLEPFAAVFGIGTPDPVFSEGHVPLSDPGTNHGAMAAVSEGEMGRDSIRSMIVFDRVASGGDRDIRGVLYDGRQGGNQIDTLATRCGSGSLPVVTTNGSTLIGKQVQCQLTAAGVPLWVVGLPTTPVPLCGVGATACRLGVAVPALALVLAPTLTIQIPPNPALVGAQLAAQGIDLFVSGGCDASLVGLPFATADTLVLTVR